jgi:hypothetical protein
MRDSSTLRFWPSVYTSLHWFRGSSISGRTLCKQSWFSSFGSYNSLLLKCRNFKISWKWVRRHNFRENWCIVKLTCRPIHWYCWFVYYSHKKNQAKKSFHLFNCDIYPSVYIAIIMIIVVISFSGSNKLIGVSVSFNDHQFKNFVCNI